MTFKKKKKLNIINFQLFILIFEFLISLNKT